VASRDQLLTINLNDLNDERPVISVSSIEVFDSITDSDVLTIVQIEDVDTTNNFSYTITNDPDDLFEINNDGEISLRAGESLDYSTSIFHALSVEASDGVHTSAPKDIIIKVQQDDILNNLKPVIDEEASSATVSESATGIFTTVQYSDQDTNNGIFSFALLNDHNGLFTINTATGDISLADSQSLDYEITCCYHLQATVNDGVNTSLVGNITLNVTDTNDETPVITSSSDVFVAETQASGSVIHTVEFTDRDTNNSTISYSLNTAASQLLEINQQGQILLRSGQTLDFDNGTNSYELMVTVSDGVNTSASQTITVHVSDANDTAPQLVSENNVSVDENIADTVVIHRLAHTDLDTTNSNFSYAITNDPSSLFEIDTSTGEISLKAGHVLDAEVAGSYTLTVTVSDGLNTSSPQTLTIDVNDLNDNLPVIDSVNTVSVAEDVDTVTVIHTVTNTDADISTSTNSYSITSDPSGFFEINSSGEITLKQGVQLDRETSDSHSITVQVNDGVNNSAAQDIAITVNDINDSPVAIISSSSSIVSESVSDSDVLINVNVTDSDTSGTQTFSIIDDPNNLFEINNNGEITLQAGQSLDYESATAYQLTVKANDGVRDSLPQLITINVTDENDTAPEVVAEDVVLDENSHEEILDADIVDEDTVSSTVDFYLSDDANGVFQINSEGIVTFTDGTPEAGTYQIAIIAYDGVNESQSKTIDITVAEPDSVNNNAPEVDIAASSGSVSESIDSTTPIATVQYTDSDPVDGTEVYTFALTNDAGGLFEIDVNTGVITLAAGQSLDYENTSSHTVTVTVSDGTNTSTATDLTIDVNDVNDNAPIISSGTSVNINELATINTVLHQVIFTDADIVNGNTHYSISDGPFQIDSAGQITLKPGQSLDFESVDRYQVTVAVNDGVNTSASQTITFTVIDSNDQAPELAEFTSQTVAENLSDSSVIVSASASDADSTGETISYQLTDNSGGLFEINASTGDIRLANGQTLDYEAATSHTVTVIATDGSNHSSEQILTINVSDVNDVAPTITSDNNTETAESAQTDQVLHTVTFEDSDTSMVTFSIVTDSSNLFEVDTSGAIRLQAGKSLDFETDTSHSLIVEISDGVQTSQQSITINVVDVNDNAPLITTSTAIDVAESISDSDIIHTVAYQDADSTADTFTYSLVSDPDSLFEIDSDTGEISLRNGSSLDFETAISHNLVIAVSDGIHTTKQNLLINVANVDDEAPVISSVSEIQVLENLSSGASILIVEASDNTSSELTYTLSSNPDGKFAIDSASGEITLADSQTLDHGAAAQHIIQVTVTDEANNSTNQIITINVELLDDLNNITPIILDGDAATFSVNEDVAAGQSFGALQLQDIDINDSTFTFSLIDDAGGLFQIDPATGAVSVAAGQSLDYENSSGYTLQAQVSDGVNSSAVQDVIININDIDDVTPALALDTVVNGVIQDNATTISLDENTQGTLAHFVATDADSTSFTWSISTDPSGLFNIDENGQLSVKSNQTLNFESLTDTTVGIQVTDANGNASSVFSLTVNLNDTNDIAASLTSANSATVTDDAVDTTVLHTLTSSDTDTVNGTTEYRLHNSDQADFPFEINSNTGEITLKADFSLDASTMNSYDLQVGVYDGANFSGWSALSLIVNPAVDNNNAPVAADATVGIAEGINEHSVFHQLSFTDGDDPGLNNGTVYSYSITDDPSGLFEIDSDGYITLAAGQTLDFSTSPSHTIQVAVSDGINTSNEASITLNFSDLAAQATIDVSSDQDDFQILGDGSSDNLGGSVTILGDINGDGYDDIMVAGRLGDTGGTDAGNAYVVYGKADGFADINEDDINGGDGSLGFMLIGRHSNDTSGNSVAALGDINGDGYGDFIIGARFAEDDSSNGKEGEAYVIYGQAGSFGSQIDFQSSTDYDGTGPNGVLGFEISGIANGDWLGSSVEGVGDVNGDGYDDFLVSAAGANGYNNGSTDAGEVYLVYGRSTPFSDFFATDIEDNTLDGFVVWGRDTDDFLGSDENGAGQTEGIASAGDINGDGYADFIISAKDASQNSTEDGEAYVIFGGANLTDYDLDTYTFDGSNGGFEIYGENGSDNLGYSISAGGDLNGDGYADILVGALGNDTNGSGAGAAYVIFGKADGFSNIDLNTPLDGSNGFSIYGEAAGNALGAIVALEGDINGDGYDDILLANQTDNGVYVIFGKASGFGTDLDLSTMSFDGSDGIMITGFSQDIEAISTLGDINSDGYDDIVVGSTDDNDAWVILGQDFSGQSGSVVLKSAVSGAVETGIADTTDHFMGSENADAYQQVGTDDSVSAAAGDDSISISSNDFLRIDGGHGTDTLVTQLSLDLTQVADNKLTDIEVIDIQSSGAEITLNSAEILNISGSTNTLRIDGTEGKVSIFEDGFTQQADAIIDGTSYYVYANGNATVQIQSDLLPNINANAPTVDTASFNINEGEAITITTAMLNATDADSLITSNSDLTFTATATDGSFQLNAQDAASFTLQDVIDGNVTFAHDGSETAPSYVISVSDGVKSSDDSTGSFAFTGVNDNAPVINGSEIDYKPNEAKVIDTSMLSISDADIGTANEDLVFTLSNLTAGEFRLNDVTAITFTLADIIAGNVSYFNANEENASFDIVANDGSFNSSVVSGSIEPRTDIETYLSSEFEDGAQDILRAEMLGDINGDGIDDFAMAYRDGSQNVSAVIFGSTSLTGWQDIDLSALDGTNGFKITTDQQNGSVGDLHGVGDINGDGIVDLVIARNVNEIGSYLHGLDIIYGRTDWSGGDADQRTYSDVFIKNGVTGLGYFEDNEIGIADFNQDGFADISIAFSGGDETFIVYGSIGLSDFTLKTSTATGNTGEVIDGNGSRTRPEIQTIGDFNGDGFDDVIVEFANAQYMLFGSEQSTFENDLTSLDGSNGVALTNGTVNFGQGDFNGDGYDDFISFESNNVSVHYGSVSFNASIDLSSVDGSTGFAITGETLRAGSFSANFIGDINADGYDDIHVSNSSYTNGDASRAGQSFIIFGAERNTASFDLTSLEGSNGFNILGTENRESFGKNVKPLGDINGDGYDDLWIESKAGDFIFFGGDFGDSGTVGTSGNDSITGIGTDGTAIGAGGNDSISVSGNDFHHIDGGSGVDSLVFAGSDIDLDLTDVANLNKVKGIEAIDMGDANGSSSLALGLNDILDLPSSRDYSDDLVGGSSTDDATSDILRVMGDADDSVALTDFTDTGTDVVVDGITYDLYSHDSVDNGDILIDR
jgi:hypothetical protein